MHRPSVRFVLAGLFSFLLLNPPAAGAASTITGKVVDQDGRPVPSASVLVSGAGVPLVTTTTGEAGLFEIGAPERTRLTVRIAKEGFRAEPLTVDVNGLNHDVGTITLTLSALSEAIVVSAAQVEVPLTQVTSSVTIVTGAELEARQVHTAADALRSVPGLAVVANGGLGAVTSVFPRGGESNYTLVLIDGVPANAFGGDYDFGQLSAANIDRIEIVRGPQSALYGANAIGAVVRIVTRKGGTPSGSVMAEGGGFGTSRVSASTAGQRGTFEWGGLFDQLLSDGRNGDTTAAGESIVNDDYARRTAAMSAGWRDGSAWVRGDFRYSTDERGTPGPFGSDPIGSYEGIDAISRGENDRTLGAVSTSIPLSSRVRLQAQGTFNRIASDFASPFGLSESASRRVTGRAQVDLGVGAGVDASAGFEALGERARSTFITGAAAQEIPIERTVVGYFGEARWSAQDRLFVTAGLRVEDIRRQHIEEAPSPFSPRPDMPADTVVSVNPRVSAAWLARGDGADYTRVRGAVGTGIRPPDGFELAFTDNPELKPERSLSAEIGVDRAFAAGHALAEATAFFNNYDDLIITVGSFTGSSQYRTDNIANARAQGLELALTLRGRIAAGRPVDVSGRIGYTLLDTEVLAVDLDDAAPPPFEVGQPLLRRPKHQFFADAAVTVSAFSAFVRGGGRGETLDVEPSFGTFGGLFDAPGYQVWDIGASFRIGRYVDAFGRVENLFNRTYEEAFGFPALGRRATAGLRVAAGR